jgi:hypothetical protein
VDTREKQTACHYYRKDGDMAYQYRGYRIFIGLEWISIGEKGVQKCDNFNKKHKNVLVLRRKDSLRRRKNSLGRPCSSAVAGYELEAAKTLHAK